MSDRHVGIGKGGRLRLPVWKSMTLLLSLTLVAPAAPAVALAAPGAPPRAPAVASDAPAAKHTLPARAVAGTWITNVGKPGRFPLVCLLYTSDAADDLTRVDL